ncbi:hypothetical protein [Vibrio gazogenes]|uniref:hypothetical protein n=1 Tax=Vibrio gazogenes TaxID=687 RepID=UPI0019671571|nr:hypothetical protein [Vibrio gazogenes]USP16090.1 hypothetical protein MKS89_17035 [Vibrio gazogenes]
MVKLRFPRTTRRKTKHKFLDTSPAVIGLGKNQKQRSETYVSFFRGHIDEKETQKLSLVTQQNMALGNDRFKQEIEQLTGRRVTPLKRGPKRKEE